MKDFFVSDTGQDRTWVEWIAWVLEADSYRWHDRRGAANHQPPPVQEC